jgi:MFS family permease
MSLPADQEGAAIRLGLSENRVQFILLMIVNAFVGAMVGVERSVLPTLAESEFGVTSAGAAFSFLVAFGLAKALANFMAGDLADRVGRKRILVAGWIVGLPVPVILMFAPTWTWVVVANSLLGVNQGLAWSATVIMKIDLVGPRRRGLAMGLNEFAGYLAVSLAALGAGFAAASYGPRPVPFLIAAGAAVFGLVLSVFMVKDTASHVALERQMAQTSPAKRPTAFPSHMLGRLRAATFGDRTLMGAHQAGLVNNLNDGLAWALLPIYLAQSGVGQVGIGWVAAVYPAVWGFGQLGTGAWSDRIGRRPLIVWGMALQALALVAFASAHGMAMWIGSAVLLGLGTAAVYPTLIAQVSDAVSPTDRATAVGTYRLWRDLGYVVGAVLAGVVSDVVGYQAAILVVAALTALSSVTARVLLPPPTSTEAAPT